MGIFDYGGKKLTESSPGRKSLKMSIFRARKSKTAQFLNKSPLKASGAGAPTRSIDLLNTKFLHLEEVL